VVIFCLKRSSPVAEDERALFITGHFFLQNCFGRFKEIQNDGNIELIQGYRFPGNSTLLFSGLRQIGSRSGVEVILKMPEKLVD
jgi:hypothetical protein